MHALWMEIDLAETGEDVRHITDELVERAVEPTAAQPLWVSSASELLGVMVFVGEDQARRASGRFVIGQQVGEPQGGATLTSLRVGTVMGGTPSH